MWRVVYFEENEEKDFYVGDSYIDLETELLALEDQGINTNQVKVFYGNEDKLNYLEAMELCQMHVSR